MELPCTQFIRPWRHALTTLSYVKMGSFRTFGVSLRMARTLYDRKPAHEATNHSVRPRQAGIHKAYTLRYEDLGSIKWVKIIIHYISHSPEVKK